MNFKYGRRDIASILVVSLVLAFSFDFGFDSPLGLRQWN
jgi:hypothetical protein